MIRRLRRGLLRWLPFLTGTFCLDCRTLFFIWVGFVCFFTICCTFVDIGKNISYWAVWYAHSFRNFPRRLLLLTGIIGLGAFNDLLNEGWIMTNICWSSTAALSFRSAGSLDFVDQTINCCFTPVFAFRSVSKIQQKKNNQICFEWFEVETQKTYCE